MVKKKQALTKKVYQLEQLTQKLNDPTVSTNDKKGIVIELAHLGTDVANKVLSDYKKAHPDEPDEELKTFTDLALEEGTFMAASDEDLTKKAVWDELDEELVNYYARLETVNCEIADYKYQLEIVKRLHKKASKADKFLWQIRENAFSGLLKDFEDAKVTVEENIKVNEAMIKEVETELPENLRNSDWRVGGCYADCCCEEEFDDEEDF